MGAVHAQRRSDCKYPYTCVYMYINVYIYMYINIHIHMNVYIYTDVYAYIFIHIYIYMSTYIYIYICIYILYNHLELLCDGPCDEVACGRLPPRHGSVDALPRDLALQTDLHHGQDVRQLARVHVHRAEQHEDLVRRSVREQLQVVGRVLVVGRDAEREHPLEEALRGGVVGEERIAVHPIELALGRVWRRADGGQVGLLRGEEGCQRY